MVESESDEEEDMDADDKGSDMVSYGKFPKFWDARNLCCNLPKIQTKRQNLKGYFVKMVQMEKANSEDPDHTVQSKKMVRGLKFCI